MTEQLTPPIGKTDDGESLGVTCGKCGCGHLDVVWVRHRPGVTIRRRECRNCGGRVMTYERRG